MMTREAFIAGVVAGTIVKTKGGLCPLCGYPKSPNKMGYVCGAKECRSASLEAYGKGEAVRKQLRATAAKQLEEIRAEPAAIDKTNWGDLTPFVANYDYGQYVYCADPITGF